MTPKKAAQARRPTLSAAFDENFSAQLQVLRGELDRLGKASHVSANLAALEASVERLRFALKKVERRRTGDINERLDELDYPFAKLKAFFAHKKSALDKRATEIMAEYIRDRMLEIRIISKTFDSLG